MFFNGSEIPERHTIDVLAEQRERRDQRTRARMNRQAYQKAIMQRLREAMEDRRTPLGEAVDRLYEAPLRDAYDHRAYLALHDGKQIGTTVLTMICDESLYWYQDADLDGF